MQGDMPRDMGGTEVLPPAQNSRGRSGGVEGRPQMGMLNAIG